MATELLKLIARASIPPSGCAEWTQARFFGIQDALLAFPNEFSFRGSQMNLKKKEKINSGIRWLVLANSPF